MPCLFGPCEYSRKNQPTLSCLCLLQIIRNEQLSILVSTVCIQGTLKHHVIFVFTFRSAGSIIQRPAMITDPLHPSTGFKINPTRSPTTIPTTHTSAPVHTFDTNSRHWSLLLRRGGKRAWPVPLRYRIQEAQKERLTAGTLQSPLLRWEASSLAVYSRVLFLHDSRDCPETAVSLLHQKRLGSGSEPTKEKIKLLK